MKLVIVDGHALNPGDLSYEVFRELGELEIYESTPKELVAERIKDADMVFLNKVNITKEILARCEKLKYIGVFATGYNVVDIDAAREAGVTVTNIPEYSTMAVAQAVFALLFEVTNGVAKHNASVQQGDWCKSEDFCYWVQPIIELSGKTLGIFGFGNIGQRVAKIAAALGMKVIVHTRSKTKIDEYNAGAGRESQVEHIALLDEFFAKSDVITLHCPLTPQTENIINENSIAKMKDGAILINTARGQLVDEAAVKRALDTKKLFAFATDVLRQEPMAFDNPLLGNENCIITPHIAWAPKETRQRLLEIAVQNARRFLAGNPVNVVNK